MRATSGNGGRDVQSFNLRAGPVLRRVDTAEDSLSPSVVLLNRLLVEVDRHVEVADRALGFLLDRRLHVLPDALALETNHWLVSYLRYSQEKKEKRTQKMCLHDVATASSASSRQSRHMRISSGLSPGACWIDIAVLECVTREGWSAI